MGLVVAEAYPSRALFDLLWPLKKVVTAFDVFESATIPSSAPRSQSAEKHSSVCKLRGWEGLRLAAFLERSARAASALQGSVLLQARLLISA